MKFVQYECIKSELKEEYDKKIGFLHKRLNKKAQIDPSFLLLNNLTAPISAKNTKTMQNFMGVGSPLEHQYTEDVA